MLNGWSEGRCDSWNVDGSPCSQCIHSLHLPAMQKVHLPTLNFLWVKRTVISDFGTLCVTTSRRSSRTQWPHALMNLWTGDELTDFGFSPKLRISLPWSWSNLTSVGWGGGVAGDLLRHEKSTPFVLRIPWQFNNRGRFRWSELFLKCSTVARVWYLEFRVLYRRCGRPDCVITGLSLCLSDGFTGAIVTQVLMCMFCEASSGWTFPPRTMSTKQLSLSHLISQAHVLLPSVSHRWQLWTPAQSVPYLACTWNVMWSNSWQIESNLQVIYSNIGNIVDLIYIAKDSMIFYNMILYIIYI